MTDEPLITGPRAMARVRLAIIAGLIASPPPDGELQEMLDELADKMWMHPLKGTWIKYHRSSIERWYYKAKDVADPLTALIQKRRSDAGNERVMSSALMLALEEQYKEHPGWSRQLHHQNIEALAEQEPERYGKPPSYSTVRRRMKKRGWKRKQTPKNPTPGQRKAAERVAKLEIRSYEVEYVHGLWHLDFHEGSLRVVDKDGRWHTPVVLCILDDHSRLCCHIQWYLIENAENLAHGLMQAFHKRGLPRELMEDNGGAMRAEENVSPPLRTARTRTASRSRSGTIRSRAGSCPCSKTSKT